MQDSFARDRTLWSILAKHRDVQRRRVVPNVHNSIVANYLEAIEKEFLISRRSQQHPVSHQVRFHLSGIRHEKMKFPAYDGHRLRTQNRCCDRPRELGRVLRIILQASLRYCLFMCGRQNSGLPPTKYR